MANSIASFNFVALDTGGAFAASPEIPKERVEVIQRRGDAGSLLRLLGTKGEPFPMRSFVDTSTLAAAVTLHGLYAAIIGQGLAQLVWRGIDYDAVNVRFHVLDVRIVETVPLRASAGGLTPGSLAGLACSWILLPEAYTP